MKPIHAHFPLHSRRRFIVQAATAFFISQAAWAQPPVRTYRIGVLAFLNPKGAAAHHREFEAALAEHGFIVGRNLKISYVYGDGMHEAARDLVLQGQDVLFASNPNRVDALREATRSIPIVFAFVSDPVRAGLVASLAKPGGNITGVSNRYEEFAAKRLELARELLPKARRIALIADFGRILRSIDDFPITFEKDASRLGFEVIRGDIARYRRDLAATLASILSARPEAIFPYGSLSHRESVLAPFQIRHRIPVIDHSPGFGVVAFDEDEMDAMRRAGAIVARVLKGAHPAEIPVDRATRYQLSVNLASARAIGLEIPRAMVVRADKVIGQE